MKSFFAPLGFYEAVRRRLLVLLALGAVAAVGSVAPSALAQTASASAKAPPAPVPASIKAEVIILYASNKGTGIDPKLGKSPQLSQGPFAAFNSYELLQATPLNLELGRSATTKMPNDDSLVVTFKGLQPPAKPTDPTKYVIATSVLRPNGTAFLPQFDLNTAAQNRFFIMGQKYKEGIIIVAIKVLP
jgi:hypothetical protein